LRRALLHGRRTARAPCIGRTRRTRRRRRDSHRWLRPRSRLCWRGGRRSHRSRSCRCSCRGWRRGARRRRGWLRRRSRARWRSRQSWRPVEGKVAAVRRLARLLGRGRWRRRPAWRRCRRSRTARRCGRWGWLRSGGGRRRTARRCCRRGRLRGCSRRRRLIRGGLRRPFGSARAPRRLSGSTRLAMLRAAAGFSPSSAPLLASLLSFRPASAPLTIGRLVSGSSLRGPERLHGRRLGPEAGDGRVGRGRSKRSPRKSGCRQEAGDDEFGVVLGVHDPVYVWKTSVATILSATHSFQNMAITGQFRVWGIMIWRFAAVDHGVSPHRTGMDRVEHYADTVAHHPKEHRTVERSPGLGRSGSSSPPEGRPVQPFPFG
jgi:hypothetical protein